MTGPIYTTTVKLGSQNNGVIISSISAKIERLTSTSFLSGPTGPNKVSTTTSTDINGLIKGNGSTILKAIGDVDYTVPATFDVLAAIVAAKAPLASPVFTGVPVAPTAASGTNTTQLATTAFVEDEILAKAKSRVITTVVAPNGTVADSNTTGTADQNIINTALSSGPVRLRKGSYSISGPILMPTNGYLEAEDGVTITLANSSNLRMLSNADLIGGNSNITIKNIIFDANKAGQVSSTADALYFNLVIGATLENVTVLNSSQMGIDIANSSFIKVTGGKVNASTTRNIYLTATTDSCIDRVEVAYGGTTGIEMENGSHRNELIRNYVHHSGTYSIMGGSSAGTQNEYCRFVQNRVIYGGDDGLVIDHNNYALVDGNYVGYCGSHAGDQGLPIDTSLHVMCVNNRVEYNRADGIEVKNSSNYTVISNNIVRNNSNPIVGGASDGSGIVVRGNTTYCAITGNTSFCDEVSPSQRRGILLTDAGNDYNVVTGNTVYNNSVNQIAEAGGIGTTSHNKIFANSGAESSKIVDEPKVIRNSTTSSAMSITQTGNVGSSRTNGMFYGDNSGNTGNGFTLYDSGLVTGKVGPLSTRRVGDTVANVLFDFNPAIDYLYNVSTQSAMLVEQVGNFIASRAAIVVQSSAVQTLGYGLIAARMTSASSTIPGIWVDQAGSGYGVQIRVTNSGTGLKVTNTGSGLGGDIEGKLKVGSLQVGPSATSGYVLTADSSGNATFQASTGSGANTEWLATDNGLLSWSYDPTSAINGTIIPTAGQMQCVRLKVLAGTITNIIMDVFTAGATLTSGQCFAAIYQGGTLLGQTVDQATAWTTTNAKTMALASPVTVTAGYVYVTFWANGTTLPTFCRNVNRSNVNTGLSSSNYRFATSGSSITTTAPGTLGTLAASSTSWYVALS